MRRATEIIKIYKNIFLDYSVLITAACCIMFSNINFYYILFSAGIHELAHFSAAALCGYKPKYFVLKGFGIEMNNMRGCVTSNEMLFISSSGPLANILLAFVGYHMHNSEFFLINISTAALNFLPVFPLDGGQFLYSLLMLVTDRKKARFLLDILCRVMGGMLMLCGICILAATKFNFSLIYIGAVVFLSGSGYVYNPVIETNAYENRRIYKAGLFVLNASDNLIADANFLPANAVGAIKNEKGEIVKFITPQAIYKTHLQGGDIVR